MCDFILERGELADVAGPPFTLCVIFFSCSFMQLLFIFCFQKIPGGALNLELNFYETLVPRGVEFSSSELS